MLLPSHMAMGYSFSSLGSYNLFLYPQLATNTLERVAPLTHAVGNVLKRVFVIGFSILVFGKIITANLGIFLTTWMMDVMT